MKLRDIKRAKLSWLALSSLALRFPKIIARLVIEFTRNNRRDIFRLRLPSGLQNTRAVPKPGSGVPGSQQIRSDSSLEPFNHDEVASRPAPIVAQCFDSWGDLDDAITFLTPGGKGIWGNVAFVRTTSFQPDWYVFFNSPGGQSVSLNASPNRIIFAIGEPPTDVHRPLHEGQGEKTIVLTSDKSLVKRNQPSRHYLAAPALTRAWSVKKTYDFLKTSHVEDKPKSLSWVTSNLDIIPDHRDRLNFLSRIKNELDFDLFGRGFNPIDDKWSGLAPYKYSIAFENTKSDLYFTEKLMDCFVAETMPIYHGSPKIDQYFPAESMVVIDPADPQVVDTIKAVIESDRWKTNRPALLEAKHLVLEKYNTFAYLAEFMENNKDPAAELQAIRIDPVHIDFGRRQ